MDSSQDPTQIDPSQIMIGPAKLNRNFVIVCSFFLAILFGFAAYLFSSNAITLMLYGKETQGTIISIAEHPSAGKAVTWDIDVSYTSPDGNTHVAAINTLQTSPSPVGSAISILYNPNDPTQIAVDNYFFLIVQIAQFSIFPLLMLIIGIFAIRKPVEK